MRLTHLLTRWLLSVVVIATTSLPCFGATPNYTGDTYGFGDFSNGRPMPTSGLSLTGTYRTSGDWVQTGTIQCDGCICYFGGSVTINGTWSQNNGTTGMNAYTYYGLGLVTPFVFPYGAGGAHVSSGGASSDSSGIETTYGSGFGTFDYLPLYGSGGWFGIGSAGGAGANGGGALYIEATGPVLLTSTASIQLPGGNGASSSTASCGGGGGGAGGGVDLRSKSTITLDFGSTINVDGGNGGNDTATSGHGGGSGAGGFIGLYSAIPTTGVVNNGTQFTSAGTPGTGSSGHNGSAGGSGGLQTSNTYGWPGRARSSHNRGSHV